MPGKTSMTTSDTTKKTKAATEIDRMAVKISHLDTLLGLTGEIIITASNISILQRHLVNSRAKIDKNSMELIKNAALTANRISSDLHHLVMDIRMVPIKESFLKFRRMVRDMAKKRGKEIDFELVGEDTLVDKTVAERLYEPLAHQIRNAIDHGLEEPLERKGAGKEATGHLRLSAYKKDGFTYVSVADDGRGLNKDAIRRVAIARGLIREDTYLPSDASYWNLIMEPGFSTNSEATETSGRGVGMDVVKSTVESLGGEIIIESQPNVGSLFIYKIPQLSAVNIIDALIIKAGEIYYAVPIGNVVATQAVEQSLIHTAMGGEAQSVSYLGTIIPLHDLSQLLTGEPLPPPADIWSIIIIDAKNGKIALKVSEFVRPQKLVLIPLPEVFTVRGISGATILGGSQLGMVLEPYDLINLATGVVHDVETHLSQESSDDTLSLPIDNNEDKDKEKHITKNVSQAAENNQTKNDYVANPELDESLAEEFFVEIQDILNQLNEEIFQLEKDPDNMSRINTIFRYFHSIKGNFIMTGFNKVGAFVHDVETVLDHIRDRQLIINQEIIDLLLDAVKNMEAGLAFIRNGNNYEVEDQELLELLAKYKISIAKEVLQEENVGVGTFKLSPLALMTYQNKRSDPEVKIYQSLIHLGSSFQDFNILAYLILRRLALIGDLIDVVPPLSKIEAGLPLEKFKIMFASKLSLEEINHFFTRQLVTYYSVNVFENLLME